MAVTGKAGPVLLGPENCRLACSSQTSQAPVPMPSFPRRAVLQRATLPKLAVLAGLVFGVAGCSVTAVDLEDSGATVNQCDAQSDCASGSCVGGRCQAMQGFFSTMLVEVSPPASGDPAFAGVSYLHRLDDLDLKGESREIKLAQPVTVTGTVSFDNDLAACPLSFVGDEPGSTVMASPEGVPVSVSFTPSDRILGVASTEYNAEASLEDPEEIFPEDYTWSFRVNLPPGDYDIYIRPRAPAAGGCQIPPRLVRRYKVEASNLLLNLPSTSPAFTFALTVKWPKASGELALKGWTVEMLDPLTGLVVSTQGVLGDPLGPGAYEEYSATIAYAPVALEGSQSERVRLSPPKGVDAPSVILARSVLELFSPGFGEVNLAGFPEPVSIEGQLTLAGVAEPTPGRVTVVSTSLEGAVEGVFASFVRSADTDDDGNFTLRLLPGTYHVYAWPAVAGASGSRASAATETDWEIAADPPLQAGKTVELLPPSRVFGRANLPQGDPASGATVIANPSPRDVQIDLLTQAAQGDLAVTPAAQSAITAGDGKFDLLADPGIFDVSVRAPEGSGFAWYVASHVYVEAAKEKDLGTPFLPLPVPYSGRVLVPINQMSSVPIAEALLRAYVYLDENNAYTGDPTRAASVVQIGETRADADGNFELLIPANLN